MGIEPLTSELVAQAVITAPLGKLVECAPWVFVDAFSGDVGKQTPP